MAAMHGQADDLSIQPGSFWRQLLIALSQVFSSFCGDQLPNSIPGRMEAHRVDGRLRQLNEGRLAWQDQRISDQGQVFRLPVLHGSAQGVHEGALNMKGFKILCRQCIQHSFGAKTLHGLPAVEGIRVEGGKQSKVLVTVILGCVGQGTC